jgi:hypothetical protein
MGRRRWCRVMGRRRCGVMRRRRRGIMWAGRFTRRIRGPDVVVRRPIRLDRRVIRVHSRRPIFLVVESLDGAVRLTCKSAGPACTSRRLLVRRTKRVVEHRSNTRGGSPVSGECRRLEGTSAHRRQHVSAIVESRAVVCYRNRTTVSPRPSRRGSSIYCHQSFYRTAIPAAPNRVRRQIITPVATHEHYRCPSQSAAAGHPSPAK